MQFDVSGLASLALLLNSMALLIAVGGAWLLLATRWRQQLAVNSSCLAGHSVQAVEQTRMLATQRIDRFFYCFGFSSLGLAWLLSSLTRLV
ncbi:hypothetical protein D7241_19385 [Stutzerimonas sp. VN223-3]|uniref:hypothetical protein n=1 Tax=Stutzerimonas TaxID=2901164 RepID=UPI002109AFE2|nr:hypothetical protein [Stutzerimonas stutzeri]MCQ4313086.1 hypothetical protein [Stutzerimonas stutzeri]